MIQIKGTYAKASNNNDTAVEVSKYEGNLKVEIAPEIEQPSIELYGVKSKVVVKVAQLLKDGGDKVIDAAKSFNIVDSATAKTFENNSKKIGNCLYKFANAGENAANDVRAQLPIWLKKNTEISKGIAENISIVVAWAIRGADGLFL
ncbi:hypothetical protein H7992_20190 [Sporosarcina sp. resist]|uniref:hypothetical protein n=1 Tax=Sporosarcina sp. resist TaxID=2762563 RepID=UPI00164DA09B|nr:hypothetical protein [Sporosarcina sp. resist]QNK87480.1 hypothetical protein H7992_20190 [Sporosarcina sp. resist]